MRSVPLQRGTWLAGQVSFARTVPFGRSRRVCLAIFGHAQTGIRCASRRCGSPASVRRNTPVRSLAGHALPSLVNGSEVQADEIGSRRSATTGLPKPRESNLNSVRLLKCPTTVSSRPPPCGSCHVTNGVLPVNVMSGLAASRLGSETGLPPFASSKWSPTRRATKIACLPVAVSSAHATHGEGGLAGLSVPEATCGSSASLPGSAFSEQAPSAAMRSSQAPLPAASRMLLCPAVPLPTACQWKPAAPAVGSGTALAAKTCSLPARPAWESSFSYQTVHGTWSSEPVNAMSGSMPLRVRSMFSDGSSLPAGSFESSRLMPVCCQQNLLTLVPPPGSLAEQSVCLIPRETKIWSGDASLVEAPSFSCQATHGVGSLPTTAAPPATDGFSASRSVLMFSEGTLWAGARSWPSGAHLW